jgi:hypothetical protein
LCIHLKPNAQEPSKVAFGEVPEEMFAEYGRVCQGCCKRREYFMVMNFEYNRKMLLPSRDGPVPFLSQLNTLSAHQPRRE